MNRAKQICRSILVCLVGVGLLATGVCPGLVRARSADSEFRLLANPVCCCGTADGRCCGKPCCLRPTSKLPAPNPPAPTRGGQRDLSIAGHGGTPAAIAPSDARGGDSGTFASAPAPVLLSLQSQHVRIQT